MLKNETLFPEKEEIFSWVEHMCQFGHRKTGTPQSRMSAEFIAGKLKEFGAEEIAIEECPSLCMFMDEYSLNIEGKDYECFYINASHHVAETGEFKFGGEKQEFVYLGEGLNEDFEGVDVKDKIVVCSINLPSCSFKDIMGWFKSPELYDPDNVIDNVYGFRPDIYSPDKWPANYFNSIKHGAAGFIGILENYMDDPYFYCEDYTEIGQPDGIELMKIPGLWISKSEGKILKEAFAKKPVLEGEMKMTTRYEYKSALNVKGIMPGMSDEIILMHSHHDAVWNGAVQDASGISIMLAMAKYFGQMSKEDRPKTLMFAATDTHYTDYMGHQGFIKARHEAGDNIILDVATEHIGKEYVLDDAGNMVETGEVEGRLFYLSKESGIADDAIEIFKRWNLEKSIFSKVNVGKGINAEEYVFQQDEVISDAYYFSEDGIPVVSMVCAEIYLFHPSDKADKVPPDQLEKVGKAFAEVVETAQAKM